MIGENVRYSIFGGVHSGCSLLIGQAPDDQVD